MTYDNIKVGYEAGIATITLDRPEKLNAFVGHMRRDLAQALERTGSAQDVRVVIITGAGRGFCAGADVAYMAELMERQDVDEFTRLLGAGRRVLTAIRQMTKPVIASVNGPAYGAGFNLALCCDLRIASESASFSQSFVKVGLHPDWGGTYFLPRVVPTNLACEMFFLGDAIDAGRALQLGLVNRVVPDDALAGETRKLAERLRDAPYRSIAAAKHAVYMSEESNLERMLQYETEAQLQCFQSEEARKRVRAFLERRDAARPSLQRA
ncbi:MAG TPA: enoyl-CoA hydratase/isomerase family protein [Pyrinomonadaceae bacterium]|jgi:2-(1,2-epoxy-1,2-dihydrophenyl)acetyl-CoA isomerase|nr:enoyl-CoA hydratase/isomerase family protein [Pyrinomonadaceae bacterium]